MLPRRSSYDFTVRVFVDFLFIMVLYIVVAWIFPIGEKKKKDEDTKMHGMLSFEIIWTPDVNVDLDLWVLDPDGTSVGYSNRASLSCNLLRDDLGLSNDTQLRGNDEIVVCRRAEIGDRFGFAVHYYADKQPSDTGIPPSRGGRGTEVDVDAVVRFLPDGEGGATIVYRRRFKVDIIGLEYTILFFEIGPDGRPDRSSLDVPPIGISPPAREFEPMPVPLSPNWAPQD